MRTTRDVRMFHPTKENPWIICTLSSLEEAVLAEQQGADALEFRCDRAIENNSGDPSVVLSTLQQIRKAVALPIVGTIRKSRDGGSWSDADLGNESHRMEWFERILPFVDAVDIEIESTIKKDIKTLCQQYAVKSILSYHNMQTTDTEEKVITKIEQMEAEGGDVIKLAYFNKNLEEALRLLKVLKQYTHRIPLTMLGMGLMGTVTRIVFPCFGSCLIYGYVDELRPGAPGQIPIRELHRGLNNFKAIMGKAEIGDSNEVVQEFMSNYRVMPDVQENRKGMERRAPGVI